MGNIKSKILPLRLTIQLLTTRQGRLTIWLGPTTLLRLAVCNSDIFSSVIWGSIGFFEVDLPRVVLRSVKPFRKPRLPKRGLFSELDSCKPFMISFIWTSVSPESERINGDWVDMVSTVSLSTLVLWWLLKGRGLLKMRWSRRELARHGWNCSTRV